MKPAFLDLFREYIRPYYLRWVYFRMFPQRRPLQWDVYWRHPFERVPFKQAVLPETDVCSVILYPMNDWHTRQQRTHHFAAEIATRGNIVIYLNPHLGRQFETTPLFDSAPRLSRLGANLFELHVRLPREPIFHQRVLTAAETRLIVEALRQVLGPRNVRPVVQMLSFPIWIDAARVLKNLYGFPIAYDCHDLLSGFQNISEEIVRQENLALKEADLQVFSSVMLAEKYRSNDNKVPQRKSTILPNGVDAYRFSLSHFTGPPIAAYVGALETWFDSAAVAMAANCNPNCRFRIAGRIDSQHVDFLKSLPNIELLGELPQSALPEFLKCARVGLIPFVVNSLTLAANPIKLYEYFAAGLPVVSAPLPEVECFGDLVYIARTPEEFANAIRQALVEHDSSRRARRREIAERESWAARVTVLEKYFLELSDGKAGGDDGARTRDLRRDRPAF
jgi:glycosyltransferase involved in cell wall biosynthesis